MRHYRLEKTFDGTEWLCFGVRRVTEAEAIREFDSWNGRDSVPARLVQVDETTIATLPGVWRGRLVEVAWCNDHRPTEFCAIIDRQCVDRFGQFFGVAASGFRWEIEARDRFGYVIPTCAA